MLRFSVQRTYGDRVVERRPPRRSGRSGPGRRRSRSGRRPRAGRAAPRSRPSPTSPTGDERGPCAAACATASLTIASLDARGGDDHGVGADAARPVLDRGARRSSGATTRSAPSSAASARRAARRLDAEHAAAGRAQQLDGDQPEQAEADDDHALAERRLGAAHALQRDRAERGERGVAQRHALGHGRDEVARHRDDLGVVGAPGAGAGDALADAEVGDPARVRARRPRSSSRGRCRRRPRRARSRPSRARRARARA